MEKLLSEFFSHNFDFLQLVTEGYPSHNPDHVEVWEGLFIHVFGEAPVDVEYHQHPLYRRPGSTDPRWDDLIHTKGYGRAMGPFLHKCMKGAILNIPLAKEAA